MPGRIPRKLKRLLGIELAPVGHLERAISAIGGFAAIYLVFLLEHDFLGEVGAAILVASMGASAVLLFAVPHGALSQPWAVFVGHLVSAIIGVTSAKFIADPMLAASVAVGAAIGAMHYLRAIHPPGGATALTAVIGGPQVHALGYQFVLTPVLLNTTILVLAAILINAAFAWRRYPAGWGRRLAPAAKPTSRPQSTHADFVAALESIGTFVDIREDEFERLRELTRTAAASRHLKPEDIRLGAYYSNGVFGEDWSVRRIVDAAAGTEDGDIIWRAVAGKDRNESGHCSRRTFAEWAAHEVLRSESTWVRREVEPEAEPLIE